ncbi:DsrE family protein [Pseudomonas sp. ZM23]|uniref:DsrE family protein n=1 Tax=Pseudomonas triclosanedens TaxID=2961893 RepID=A0ABY6ZVW1_9PSED|nr:DsrE family protein [Pseudomonas triclosanedens]MCP8465333.1 DsrE family protein [Pseudomonas triclosanedens]MCP8470727.1 DsrE family protein [Pseudomonas triclosanedens]MCP8476632.1 DsrE family protein [Pseudomonas triclosanedens]WAI48913.1 DsrE family protein [Pseudomonas triclosanedens]
MSTPDQQRVLIIVSSGPSTPARCAAPFYTATLLACMDAQVTLFLSGEGTRLAFQDVSDHLYAAEGGEPVSHFIQQAKEAGARLLMCRAPGVPIDESRLMEEIDEVASGGELARMILEYDRVLTL